MHVPSKGKARKGEGSLFLNCFWQRGGGGLVHFGVCRGHYGNEFFLLISVAGFRREEGKPQMELRLWERRRRRRCGLNCFFSFSALDTGERTSDALLLRGGRGGGGWEDPSSSIKFSFGWRRESSCKRYHFFLLRCNTSRPVYPPSLVRVHSTYLLL